MKQLKTLIKYHQTLLDEKRIALKKLQDQENAIINAQHFLADELARERELVSKSPEVSYQFDDYYKGNKARQEDLVEILAVNRQNMEEVEAELAEAFRELKKYEITLERREKEAQKIRDRKDQAIADENASIRHQRKDG